MNSRLLIKICPIPLRLDHGSITVVGIWSMMDHTSVNKLFVFGSNHSTDSLFVNINLHMIITI